MKKMYFYFFLALLFVLMGCAPMLTIKTGEFLDSPTGVIANFIPVKAEGKETITKGTEKIIVKSGFNVEKKELMGMDAISISKSNVQITIMHASFDFLKQHFGLPRPLRHPLINYTPMHVWGPYDAPAFRVLYKADNNDTYQVYYFVPFYNCIMDVYRNKGNKELLNKFRKAFAEGKIKPFGFNDKRTPQEIKTQMENLIGEQYCAEYYKNNIVFYVKVENIGNEKIRLWPIHESVIVDENNNQYRALTPNKVSDLLSEWNKSIKNLPHGKENPIMGVYISSQQKIEGVKVIEVVKGLSADKAGIKKDDIIIEVNDKKISKDKDISVTLSNKVPGDKINATFLRNNVEKKIELRLMSADDWPKPKPIRVLAGGNVYPNVIYDGFLVFNTEAMLNNCFKGAMIKLIIPLIGTEFTASDTPIHSFDFEFDFKMN